MLVQYTDGYKYRTKEPKAFEVPEFAGIDFTIPFVRVADGKMYLDEDYASDGPSGPTKDDDTNIVPSFCHDGFYQAMRVGKLNRKYQNLADRVMRRMCLEHGMHPFRAWYYYHALKIFGRSHTFPKKNSKLGTIFETGV